MNKTRSIKLIENGSRKDPKDSGGGQSCLGPEQFVYGRFDRGSLNFMSAIAPNYCPPSSLFRDK